MMDHTASLSMSPFCTTLTNRIHEKDQNIGTMLPMGTLSDRFQGGWEYKTIRQDEEKSVRIVNTLIREYRKGIEDCRTCLLDKFY